MKCLIFSNSQVAMSVLKLENSLAPLTKLVLSFAAMSSRIKLTACFLQIDYGLLYK